MAGPKGSKYYDYFLKYKLWLTNEKNNSIIDETVFIILKEIKEGGTLHYAANKLGISYRKAWGDIKKAEQIMGFKFIQTCRGGAKGGRSWLTDEGNKIVNSYVKLINQLDKIMNESVKNFFNSINN